MSRNDRIDIVHIDSAVCADMGVHLMDEKKGTVSRMADLKPCPFCGKEAKTMNLISDLFIVGCDYNPNCPGHIGKCAPAYYTEELAIKYWNRRDGDPDGKT